MHYSDRSIEMHGVTNQVYYIAKVIEVLSDVSLNLNLVQ